jgi:acetyl-CoA/propionyl-CoA carboxylase biotin carboxyl carrier protein
VFTKVLVANRGEIAVRVIRALEELGIASVAVYSEADRDAQHVKRATEAYLLGPGPAAESYLKVDKLLEVVEQSGAEAVHPGYGFLAENAAFARALEEKGIVFIGPPASAIDAMGSKTRARELMQAAGVPIVPGTTEAVGHRRGRAGPSAPATRSASRRGEGGGGGGGKGFRVALTERSVPGPSRGAAREGEKFFSDATVYLERYLPDPRHVEVQVLADPTATSSTSASATAPSSAAIQKSSRRRRPRWSSTRRCASASEIGVDAARAVDYVGAGHDEGLLSAGQAGEYFFLEMNTRVQVEHRVTESSPGIDIVREGSSPPRASR